MKKYLLFLLFLLLFKDLSAQNAYISSFNYNPNFQSSNKQLQCFPEGLNKYTAGFNGNFTGNPNSPFFGAMVHKTPLPGQYLRILILYVTFPDDNNIGSDMNGYAVWKDPSMPRPLNPYHKDHKFIDSLEAPDTTISFTERYRPYTISDYFCEMSMGTFDVIGDEYSVVLPRTSAEYKEMGYSCGQISREAIQIADMIYNIDFSRYNNWSMSPTIAGWEWTPGGGDKTVDMIVMEYRKAPGYPENSFWFIPSVPFGVSGIADLGNFSSIILDSTNINSGSGVTCLSVMQNYSKMTQIILHEITHRYTMNHYEIGLMTGVEHSMFEFSPLERTLFEYTTPSVLTFPYTIQSAEYTLRDYVFTGDLLKIELPEPGEYYYIANHQKKSLYDGISRAGNKCWNINGVQQDPYCDEGKGLFIYQQMTPSACNNFKETKLVQADGNFAWYIDRMVPYYIPGFNFEIPLFERIKGDPNGLAEFHQPLSVDLPNMQEVNDNPCSDEPNDFFVTLDWLGDGKDGYNIGYDEILSPYSNPRTNTCAGIPSGLTVKLLSQDTSDGSIRVKIYFNDDLALQELPPSKPKRLNVTKEIIEPVTGKFHPKLSWDKNTEPDFTGNEIQHGFYNIFRGISNSCSIDSVPAFTLIATAHSDSSTYIDTSMTLYPYGVGTGSCTDLYRSVSYKIEAVDITALASLQSERSLINGYAFPCNDSILTGINHNQLPLKYSVFNYPNPFNPVTNIKFSLPSSQYVTLKIYSISGELVYSAFDNYFINAGYHSIVFDGTNLASGVYFYTIKAGSWFESKKMVLMK